MMPSQAHFVRMMKALNIRKSMTVVIYETGKGWFATRAAFMLKAYGHPKVYILDGGFSKWTKEGRATEGSNDDAAFAAEYGYSLSGEHLIDYEGMKKASADGSIQIIDNRPLPDGASENVIPNSKVVQGPQLLCPDGTLKSADEIKQLFEAKGVDVSKPMAFTCMAGVLSSFGYAAAVKAGLPGKMYFYDGSWSEFSDKSSKEAAA